MAAGFDSIVFAVGRLPWRETSNRKHLLRNLGLLRPRFLLGDLVDEADEQASSAIATSYLVIHIVGVR